MSGTIKKLNAILATIPTRLDRINTAVRIVETLGKQGRSRFSRNEPFTKPLIDAGIMRPMTARSPRDRDYYEPTEESRDPLKKAEVGKDGLVTLNP